MFATDENEASQLLKEYNCLKRRKKRNYKNNIIAELENACGKEGKTFWNIIKALPSATRKNNVQLSPDEVCNQLKDLSVMPEQDYFDRDFEKEVEKFLTTYDHDGPSEVNSMLNILNDNISIDEIQCAVAKIKKGKSPGTDGIPAEFIKCSIETIKYDLQTLYNYILASGIYPDKWCEGLRVAIPKGENDIRPITIEPIFGKILETIFDNRITFINESFQKTDRYNGGFLKGARTQDNMFIITSCIQKQLCLGKNLYVAFVDFKKAFNFVNHKIPNSSTNLSNLV